MKNKCAKAASIFQKRKRLEIVFRYRLGRLFTQGVHIIVVVVDQ